MIPPRKAPPAAARYFVLVFILAALWGYFIGWAAADKVPQGCDVYKQGVAYGMTCHYR